MTIQQLRQPAIQFYHHPITTTFSREALSLEDVFLRVATNRYMDVTAELRSLATPKERRDFKAKRLDFVCFSGLFSHRRDDGLTRHSSLLCLDFDHLGPRLPEARALLADDPCLETELLFTSPSGDGLKWVVEIDLQRATHRTWFRAIQEYARRTYGLEADANCANESRGCLLCHDPMAYVNPLVCPY